EASWVLTTNTSFGFFTSAARLADTPKTSGTVVAAAPARNSRRVVMAVTPLFCGRLAGGFAPAGRCGLLGLLYGEVVEARLGVGLGPEAHLAGLGEGVVRRLQVLLAVQTALDLVADHFDRERVPFPSGNLDLGVLELGAALTAHDLVDPEVVFQG